ncbi:MAG: 50S ribosomal protein L32 [bacterium]|nr:50S ribosomal protein L32 [bacterium]
MALPGHRRTSSQGKKRAKTFRLAKMSVAKCGQCKAMVLPHHACKQCGYYAGRATLRVKSKKSK